MQENVPALALHVAVSSTSVLPPEPSVCRVTESAGPKPVPCTTSGWPGAIPEYRQGEEVQLDVTLGVAKVKVCALAVWTAHKSATTTIEVLSRLFTRTSTAREHAKYIVTATGTIDRVMVGMPGNARNCRESCHGTFPSSRNSPKMLQCSFL